MDQVSSSNAGFFTTGQRQFGGWWQTASISFIFTLTAILHANFIFGVVISLTFITIIIILRMPTKSAPLSFTWDADKITIRDGDKLESYPWCLVGRIDRYSYRYYTRYAGTRNGYRLAITGTLLLEVFKDGELKEYRLDPGKTDLGGRSLDELIRDLNDLHEKALIAAHPLAA